MESVTIIRMMAAPWQQLARRLRSLYILTFGVSMLCSPISKEQKYIPSKPTAQIPCLRQLDGSSRLLDGWVDLEDPESRTSYASRLIKSLMNPARRWIRDQIRSAQAQSHMWTLTIPADRSARRCPILRLPNELIMEIADQRVLNDADRMRFGSTCKLIMSNVVPVLYKYTLLRYPIKNNELNQNYMMVGHLVQSLIIHLDTDTEPVVDENLYISPYEMLEKMPHLQSVTLYFDGDVAAEEVKCILQYLLSTKERLKHIVLDVKNLQFPLAAYEARTIYDAKKAIEDCKKRNRDLQPARLQTLSVCVASAGTGKSQQPVLMRLFTGHTDNIQHLRVYPFLDSAEDPDLRSFRSQKLKGLKFFGGQPAGNIFRVAEQATQPENLERLRIGLIMDPPTLIANLNAISSDFPFSNISILQIIMLNQSPVKFAADETLRKAWEGLVHRIATTFPSVQQISLIEDSSVGAYNLLTTAGFSARNNQRVIRQINSFI